MEFFGNEGTGKSEMLLNILAGCIVPQHKQCVIFIDTDCHFSIIRLVQILEHRLFSNVSVCVENREKIIRDCLSRLYYFRCHSSIQLVETTESLKAILPKKPEICCIMIDSISAFYWQNRSSLGESLSEQELHQRRLVSTLKSLVFNYSLAVFATRGMFAGAIGRNRDDPTQSFMSQQWQKFIRHKFMFVREMSRVDQQSDLDSKESTCKSDIGTLLWTSGEKWIYKSWLISNRAPPTARTFSIESMGVVFS